MRKNCEVLRALDHGGLYLLRQRGSLTVRPRLPWSLQHYRASRERAPSATNVTWAENAADCRSSTLTPGFHVGGLGPCTARAETLGEFLISRRPFIPESRSLHNHANVQALDDFII